jgi:uncharacterized protein YdeI (BOF family)
MKKTLLTFATMIAIAGPALAQSITTIADAQRGTMVTLQGTVDRITDEDEFHLRDATGWIEVDVGPNWVPVDVGEQVTLQGFVDDDFGPREVYARSLTRADGTVITFDRRYD